MLEVSILIQLKESLMLIKGETILDQKYLECKVCLVLRLKLGSTSKLISIGEKKQRKNLNHSENRSRKRKRRYKRRTNKKNSFKKWNNQSFQNQSKISIFLWNSNLINDAKQLNLSYFVLSLSMQASDLFGFLTPQQKNSVNPSLLNSTNRSSQRGSSRRKPIFQQQKPKNDFRQSIVFNRDHAPFEQQRISQNQVLLFDFCGCQSKMTPCQIIDQTFLKDVSLRQLKQSYMEVTQSLENIKISTKKRNLFRSIPKNYPEIFFTHLNNLLKAIQKQMTPAEFNCLAWIQYHAKIEYVTYFLYEDLKKAYTNRNKFLELLDYELGKSRTNFHLIKSDFETRGYGGCFESFINDFYDSVGANLVPMTQYAKLIKLVYQKGQKIFLKLLIHFLSAHVAELSEGFRFLAHGEVDRYRTYMRELNWDIYFQEIQI